MYSKKNTKNQKKIIIITGDCGVGKTTIIPFLKKSLNPQRYLIHDMDEIGTPQLSLDWRKKTTTYWIQFAKERVSAQVTPIILGMIDPIDINDIINPMDKDLFYFIFLNLSKEERLKRLKCRGETRDILLKSENNSILLRTRFESTDFNYKHFNIENYSPAELSNAIVKLINKM